MPKTLTVVRVHNPGRASNGRRGKFASRDRKAGQHVDSYFGFPSMKRAFGTAKYNYRDASSKARGRASKAPATRKSNPPKKKLTLAQKLHFGTKRQRAAARVSLSTAGKKKRVRAVNGRARGVTGTKSILTKGSSGVNRKYRKAIARTGRSSAKSRYTLQRSYDRENSRTRIGNPGEIITLMAGNPGRKRKVGNNMAKRRRKSVSGVRRVTRRRRRAVNPKVVVRYRTRRRATHRRRRANTGRVIRRRRHSRRSNPGFLSGGIGMLVGIFGGAALTGAISARIPGQLSSGIAGYLTTGVIAYAQGTLAGKLLKNPSLGKNMVTGGLIYLGLKIAGDLVPGLSLPFGLSGMGAIGSSAFSYPQIPGANSMIYNAPVMPSAGMGRVARLGRG